MKYYVPNNTPGFLIDQEEGKDVSKKDWHMRRGDRTFEDYHIVVDPRKMDDYPVGTLAEELARDGFYVFSDSGNMNDKYLMAINSEHIIFE